MKKRLNIRAKKTSGEINCSEKAGKHSENFKPTPLRKRYIYCFKEVKNYMPNEDGA